MTVTVAAILSLDGLTSGAIYALIALALLIVFTVTRVILVPQGQFVTYAALTYGQIQISNSLYSMTQPTPREPS
jgi:branched-chain amino acid transport system permease protein